MTRYEALRASDADRDAVIDRLRKAAGEGRLEPEELEQRVGYALRARTYGELERLLADLPGSPGAPGRPARATKPLVRYAVAGAGVLAAATVALAVVAVVVFVTAAWWVALVALWLIRCCSRGCLVPPRRHAMQARRPRPTGLL